MCLESIRASVLPDLKAVDTLITQELTSRVPLIEEIGRYLIESGGKRIRPLLVLLSAEACGYAGTKHIALAVVVEFIHMATLLHDDVVDASSLRRGKKTANALWGNEASVLVGDFLYSRAFQLMVKIGLPQVMAVMANTTNTIAEGEVLQLLNVNDYTLSEEAYFEVIRRKTAELFSAGARLAAELGDSRGFGENMAQFGLHLGMTFQLIDDVLDYTGVQKKIGKNIGDDLQTGKITLPLIYLLQQGNPTQKAVALKALREKNEATLEQLLPLLEETGAFLYTKKTAQAYADKAIEFLSTLSPSPYQQALLDLTRFSVEREF